jgi:hypothetical protein
MVEIRGETPEAIEKMRECYLKMYDRFRETLHEYYDEDFLSLKMLTSVLAPLCTSLIDDHINNIPDISSNLQKAEAIQEVSIELRKRINQLTDKRSTTYLLDKEF